MNTKPKPTAVKATSTLELARRCRVCQGFTAEWANPQTLNPNPQALNPKPYITHYSSAHVPFFPDVTPINPTTLHPEPSTEELPYPRNTWGCTGMIRNPLKDLGFRGLGFMGMIRDPLAGLLEDPIARLPYSSTWPQAPRADLSEDPV